MMKVVIIGAGNMAHYFLKGLKSNEIKIVQIYNRTREPLDALYDQYHVPVTSNLNNITIDADTYIFCISDSAIIEMSQHINLENKNAIHTAGSQPLSLFHNEDHAVIWPLYSISQAHLPLHRNVPLFLEGSTEKAVQCARSIAKALSDISVEVSFEQRRLLHLNAVIVNNFTNHLLAIGEVITQKAGLDFSLLQPIIQQTFENIKSGNPSKKQTGPAIRHDTATMQQHLKLLNTQPEWQDVYQALSMSIQKMYTKES